MSNIIKIDDYLDSLAENYARSACKGFKHDQEVFFAIKQVTSNEFTSSVAARNPQSLKEAYIQAGACGISLNQVLSLAYLVPRDGRIVLDISYQGLIKIAVESGAISCCTAELVYTNDTFKSNGPFAIPDHVFDPFANVADRGQLRGGYCVAKLPDGQLMCCFMSIEAISKVRALSKSDKGKNPDASPWNTWFDQMALKTIIKRASKTWPKGNGVLQHAIHYLNTEAGEGIILDHQSQDEEVAHVLSVEQRAELDSDTQFQQYLAKIRNRVLETGQFAAATDHVNDRLSGRDSHRVYALEFLEKVKQQKVLNSADAA